MRSGHGRLSIESTLVQKPHIPQSHQKGGGIGVILDWLWNAHFLRHESVDLRHLRGLFPLYSVPLEWHRVVGGIYRHACLQHTCSVCILVQSTGRPIRGSNLVCVEDCEPPGTVLELPERTARRGGIFQNVTVRDGLLAYRTNSISSILELVAEIRRALRLLHSVPKHLHVCRLSSYIHMVVEDFR